MRAIFLVAAVALSAWAQEGNRPIEIKPDVEQLQAQLKVANERIIQLEERVRLMTIQQQGAVQFFQAGQALCELDKKQQQPIKTEKP